MDEYSTGNANNEDFKIWLIKSQNELRNTNAGNF